MSRILPDIRTLVQFISLQERKPEACRPERCPTCGMNVSSNTMDPAMNESTFTFRVDDALKAEFTNAAKRRDRTAAQLLRDFMKDFVQ